MQARVGVIGATGLIGREILGILEERRFPCSELRLYASERSAGDEVEFRGDRIVVRELDEAPARVDLAFLCAPPEVCLRAGTKLAAGGALVVDLSEAGRSRPELPLALARRTTAPARGGALFAAPDPLALVLSGPLGGLASLAPPRRLLATAMASASFFGARAVEVLATRTAALLSGRDADPQGEAERGQEGEEPSAPGGDREPHPHSDVAFNCLPMDGVGAAAERDLVRISGGGLVASVRVVRVPAFHGLGISTLVELAEPIEVERARAVLREAPLVVLADGLGTRDVVGGSAITVGSLEVFSSDPRWVSFWICADNLRVGAAQNAVAVAEGLLAGRA